MELSEDDIKQAISDKRIRAITLDTSVFDGNGNRFERGLLARLSQFNGTEIEFVLSDVVVGEVRSHVARDAAEAKSGVLAALKEVGRAWQVTSAQREAAISALFGTIGPEGLRDQRWTAFAKATQLAVIESNGRVDVTKMLASYFASEPPFGKSVAKKSEFPDAIALQSLESWAKEQKSLLLVVSKDGDWRTYCKSSDHLLAIDDLALALSYFHQNAEVACARISHRLAVGELSVDAEVRDAAASAVDRMIFIPEVSSGYFFDAEIEEVSLISATLQTEAYPGGPFRVVDKPEEDVLVVEAEVEAVVEVYADISFSVFDSMDREDVAIGSASAGTEVKLSLKALLTFQGNLAQDAELVDVEIEASGRHVCADFGDVGPEWHSDSDEEG